MGQQTCRQHLVQRGFGARWSVAAAAQRPARSVQRNRDGRVGNVQVDADVRILFVDARAQSGELAEVIHHGVLQPQHGELRVGEHRGMHRNINGE